MWIEPANDDALEVERDEAPADENVQAAPVCYGQVEREEDARADENVQTGAVCYGQAEREEDARAGESVKTGTASYGLMDILLPATPPAPQHARVIRRLNLQGD